MIAGPGCREHGGVTQPEMWRYLAIGAGSRWSWDNTNSVSGIVLMQVVSTSPKCQAVQASTNWVAESSPISELSSASSSPMAKLASWSIPVQSLKLRYSSSAPHARHQLTDRLTSCVWHRDSTHIRRDDVCLQERALQGSFSCPLTTIPCLWLNTSKWREEAPPSLGGCRAVALTTQASSVPSKLYFHHLHAYATTVLQFYREPEHGTWGWQFLTWDATTE